MLRSYSNLDCINIFIIKVSLLRRFIFNRVLAPEGELLSFASPRQLLLRCSTSCIHAVEKKVTKEKATRLPLISCAPRFCRGSAEGAPAPLLTCGIHAAPLTGYSRQKLRCSERQTGEVPSVRNISYQLIFLSTKAKSRRL
jgi:hypothetical protein